jgi:hypothetical protein
MPRSRDRASPFPLKPGGSNAWELARAFLVLFAGIEAVLLVIAVLVDAKLKSLETHLILFAAASSVAALGLFMTWGDPGGRLRNAAKTLFVLFVLVGSVIALLLWAATTTSKGS